MTDNSDIKAALAANRANQADLEARAIRVWTRDDNTSPLAKIRAGRFYLVRTETGVTQGRFYDTHTEDGWWDFSEGPAVKPHEIVLINELPGHWEELSCEKAGYHYGSLYRVEFEDEEGNTHEVEGDLWGEYDREDDERHYLGLGFDTKGDAKELHELTFVQREHLLSIRQWLKG